MVKSSESEANDVKPESPSLNSINLAFREWQTLLKSTAGYHTQKAFGNIADLRGLKVTIQEKLSVLNIVPADGEDHKYKKIADRVVGALVNRNFSALRQALTDVFKRRA